MKTDIVKTVIFAVIRTVVVYLWWAAMLFLATVFLVNIWKIKWEQVLMLAALLTVITVVVYVIWRAVKRRRPR